ncbi:hypothetical protein TWF281_006778 [Arthrobotrys megalospora]
MPEGITVYDMTRMMSARFKDTNVVIEIHDRWFRNKDPSSTEATMSRDTWTTLMSLKETQIEFSAENIMFHGKQMGIPLVNDIWVRVKFSQHGHCIVLRRSEYDELKSDWDKSEKKAKPSPFAIVGGSQVMMFTDHTKWMQLWAGTIRKVTLFGSVGYKFYWADNRNGPCPIQEAKRFRDNIIQRRGDLKKSDMGIIRHMVSSGNNKYWNGIGNSHASDILFFAMIHPSAKVSTIFWSDGLMKRLLDAIEFFFAQAKTSKYLSHVPATTTSIRGFDVSDKITKWYNECFVKVYRKKHCLVTQQYLEKMIDRGLLEGYSTNDSSSEDDNRTFDIIIPPLTDEIKTLYGDFNSGKELEQRRTKLPVHRVKWKKRSTDSDWQYGYTLINVWPKWESDDVKAAPGTWKALNWRNLKGEVGPTSFHNTEVAKKERQYDEFGKRRRGPKVAIRDEISATGRGSGRRGAPTKANKLPTDPKIDPNRKRNQKREREERLRSFNAQKKLTRKTTKCDEEAKQAEKERCFGLEDLGLQESLENESREDQGEWMKETQLDLGLMGLDEYDSIGELLAEDEQEVEEEETRDEMYEIKGMDWFSIEDVD